MSTLPNGALLQQSPKPPRAPSCHIHHPLSLILSWHYHNRPANSHVLWPRNLLWGTNSMNTAWRRRIHATDARCIIYNENWGTNYMHTSVNKHHLMEPWNGRAQMVESHLKSAYVLKWNSRTESKLRICIILHAHIEYPQKHLPWVAQKYMTFSPPSCLAFYHYYFLRENSL